MNELKPIERFSKFNVKRDYWIGALANIDFGHFGYEPHSITYTVYYTVYKYKYKCIIYSVEVLVLQLVTYKILFL